ncbi:hypothetical protein DLM85_13230 [Hymenobacter edaphi]|uniref:Uncharacterized protein n=1 Tax=Hymenobacter edaphi TaxID=2211146 RepID=A0A328BF36_9BACT|nr:hypothetical protein DLM85_13230 [Hymenobacter edaphi]
MQALLVGALAGQVGFGVLNALLQPQQYHYQRHAQQNQYKCSHNLNVQKKTRRRGQSRAVGAS